MPAGLICLHGFLGLPSDWDLPGPKFDLHEDQGIGETADQWAERFCARLTGSSILVGYSLGARLAMHALVQRPDLFRGAILISGNPGLKTAEERQTRLKFDENWARRFEEDPWKLLMRDWNAQPVFEGSKAFERQEREFDRRTLSRCLRDWSLGRQRDLQPELEKLRIPMLWIAGERDRKFAEIARGAVGGFSSGQAEYRELSGAGHRVPWDQPLAFQQTVRDWIFQQGLGK